MNAITSLILTDRFARLIDGLCDDVAAAGPGACHGAPLTVLLWGRLRRMTDRFAAVVARSHAGTLPEAYGLRCPAAPTRPGASPRPAVLPRRGTWVVQVIPGAAVRRIEIAKMLDDPELAAIVAGAPQIGRVLRPLCRMLGIKPMPTLVLPRRPRPRPPARSEEPGRLPGEWLMDGRAPGRLRLPMAAGGWPAPRLE